MLSTASSGKVTVAAMISFVTTRAARALIGLVPQELTTDAFETVWATVTHSRGLFGQAAPIQITSNASFGTLTLWDKKDKQRSSNSPAAMKAPGDDRQSA